MSNLSVCDLQVGYTPGHPVSRSSFRISAGQIAAIVGPNGAGKSTLLKTLLGLLPSLGGSMSLGDVPLGQWRLESGIGYLPEQVMLPNYWTVESAIVLAASACRRGTPVDSGYALRLGGVDFDASLSVARMSKGMRQRLALALAFVPVPTLVLLDEPEAALDPAQRVRFREGVRQFARDGRIAVVASHDVSGICSIADVVFFSGAGAVTPIAKERLNDPAELVRLFAEDGHGR